MAAKPSFIPRLSSPLTLSIVLAVGLAAGAAGMYLYSNRGLSSGQDEVTSLQSLLSHYIELPSEPPTLATVSDVSRLRNEAFFARAENGDKVLIYPTSRKAYLYRPSTKKIIEVGPLNINSNTAVTQNASASASPSVQVSKAPTPTPKPTRVVIYNGTRITGLAITAEDQLRKDRPNVLVVEKANAARKTHTETVVIDLSGSRAVIANQIAGALKGKVTTLPAGEKKPDNADILIILGGNYPTPKVTP